MTGEDVVREKYAEIVPVIIIPSKVGKNFEIPNI